MPPILPTPAPAQPLLPMPEAIERFLHTVFEGHGFGIQGVEVDIDMAGVRVIVLTTRPRTLQPYIARVQHSIAEHFNVPGHLFEVFMEHTTNKGRGKGKDTNKGGKGNKAKQRPIGG